MRVQFLKLAMLVVLFAVAVGQTAPSTMPDKDSEIARLKAENAELRKQLAAAKTQPAATSPATAPAPKAFTTMQSVLANVPADLRPEAKEEWYKYTRSKFETWWEEQLVGMTVDQTMALGSKSVSTPLIKRPGVDWEAKLGFESKSFTYFGADHKWTFIVPTIDLDEAGAKKWDGVKVGTLFKLKGVISRVKIEQSQSVHTKLPVYHVWLTLRDVGLSQPD